MVTTLRATQNTYDTGFTGGTRLATDVMTDIGPFMDALDRKDTPFFSSLKKGRPGTQRKAEWGVHGVTPRGSVLAANALVGDTTLTLTTGHGVRFQQGHVLRITRASDGLYEHVWVTTDPLTSSVVVRRARGGTTALAFVIGDKVQSVGIALPQAADFPLAPVSRGRRYFNWYEEFAKSLSMSTQNRVTGNYENPDGDWLDRDLLQVGKDLKEEVELAFILGRRHEGDPNPAAADPALVGGIQQFAELSGNVFNVGGAGVALSIEAVEDATITMDEAVGREAGTRLLMNIRTKQIFNRLLHPAKYESGAGVDASGAKLTWDRVEIETGTYEFTHSRHIPNGFIFGYSPKNLQYKPYKDLDWKEKEVPTKGNYAWRGISATYTLEALGVPGMFVIYNFNTTLTAYPKYGVAPV